MTKLIIAVLVAITIADWLHIWTLKKQNKNLWDMVTSLLAKPAE